jgi:hypothetical protein
MTTLKTIRTTLVSVISDNLAVVLNLLIFQDKHYTWKKISFFAVIVLGTNKKQCKPITERYFPNAIFTW